MRTAHSAPMMKNGPNGTYVRRPIRRVASRTTRTTPGEDQGEEHARRAPRLPPASSPTPTSSFTSPIPNAPAPNGIDGRYRTAGMSDRGQDGRHELGRRPAGWRRSARRPAATGMTGRVRTSGSSRWSRSVASPMTSVDEPRPEQPRASGSAPNRSGSSPKRQRPDERDRPPSASRPPAGRVLLVVLRPAGREAVGGEAEGEPGRAQQAGSGSIGSGGVAVGRRSVSRPWRRRARARPASRARRRSLLAARTAGALR